MIQSHELTLMWLEAQKEYVGMYCHYNKWCSLDQERIKSYGQGSM